MANTLLVRLDWVVYQMLRWLSLGNVNEVLRHHDAETYGAWKATNVKTVTEYISESKIIVVIYLLLALFSSSTFSSVPTFSISPTIFPISLVVYMITAQLRWMGVKTSYSHHTWHLKYLYKCKLMSVMAYYFIMTVLKRWGFSVSKILWPF